MQVAVYEAGVEGVAGANRAYPIDANGLQALDLAALACPGTHHTELDGETASFTGQYV